MVGTPEEGIGHGVCSKEQRGKSYARGGYHRAGSKGRGEFLRNAERESQADGFARSANRNLDLQAAGIRAESGDDNGVYQTRYYKEA